MGHALLTINAGSSSIRLALYDEVRTLRRVLRGIVDRVGLRGTNLTCSVPDGNLQERCAIDSTDHHSAVASLLGWLEAQQLFASVEEVGHRVVHGMTHSEPERVTPELQAELHRTEQMTATQFQKMVNHDSGLLGVSGISSNVRDLLEQETGDVRAAEAAALFCHQAKKWIGSFAAALGGLDTLGFAEGIGEDAPLVRERICDGLGLLGIALDSERNAENAALISRDAGQVRVRVVHTDEEVMLAGSLARVLGPGSTGET